MTKSYLGAAVLACLANPALGHNWLTLPETRNGNVASTTLPCPPAPEGSVPLELPFDTDKGTLSFTAKWTTEHAGDHTIRVTAKDQEGNLEKMVIGDNRLQFYETYPVETSQGVVTLTKEGEYVLQYGWGNYRNCVDLNLKKVVSTGTDGQACPEQCDLTMGKFATCTAGACVCQEGYELTPQKVCVDPADDAFSVDCVRYCTDAKDQCRGSNTLYGDYQSCMGHCAEYVKGRAGDIATNTLHCRWHHLHIEGGAPKDHCPHASRDGGGKCEGGDFREGVSITVFGVTNNTRSNTVKNVVQEALNNNGMASENGVVIAEMAATEKQGVFSLVVLFREVAVEGTAAPPAKLPVDLRKEFESSSNPARKAILESEDVASVRLNRPGAIGLNGAGTSLPSLQLAMALAVLVVGMF